MGSKNCRQLGLVYFKEHNNLDPSDFPFKVGLFNEVSNMQLKQLHNIFKGTEGGKAFFFPFANRQCRLKVINNLVGYMSQLILSPIVTFLSGLLASLLGLSISTRPIHFGSRGLSDTSARCIDPEGLERLRTGTRKVTCTYCFFFVWSQAQSFQPVMSKRQH